MEATAAKLICREKITDATSALFADSVKIPERFIRSDEVQAAGAVVGEDETFELPVVDMAKLLDPELSAVETAKLGSACRDWGFFQLANHGVDEAAMQQMKDSTAQFFSLPLESKNAVAVRGGGFEGFGYHYNGSSSDKLDWAENLILLTQPVQDRNMEFWPANPPTFRHALDRYSVEMTSLARRVLGFMAADLGVSQEALLSAFFSREDGDDTAETKRQSMAMHHYPPCRQHRDKVLGIIPHTDTLGLTLLLQVDDTPGLQIKRGGRWFPVRPLPGAFVVNVGDILDVLTNGAYASVEHRVVPDAERSRVTVATFHEACVEGQVAPLPELVAGGKAAARYRSIGNLEFRKGTARALVQGTRFLDSIAM
ncbi:S-norcoclaurine synthase 1 [Dichanthelium oligosanthes]|uniref:S-norcoclaurine synthase 1 n=1 Tax=Dichanthelium oligosanthes TaxID=888268 RepID=A0A1E5WBU5_9POAL|nr:S-norcoclaurine synthase 1 [Dichanthelium oligosanthes]